MLLSNIRGAHRRMCARCSLRAPVLRSRPTSPHGQAELTRPVRRRRLRARGFRDSVALRGRCRAVTEMVRAACAPVAMIPPFPPICDAVAGMWAELSLHTCARRMVPSPHAEAAALSAGSRYHFALIHMLAACRLRRPPIRTYSAFAAHCASAMCLGFLVKSVLISRSLGVSVFHETTY